MTISSQHRGKRGELIVFGELLRQGAELYTPLSMSASTRGPWAKWNVRGTAGEVDSRGCQKPHLVGKHLRWDGVGAVRRHGPARLASVILRAVEQWRHQTRTSTNFDWEPRLDRFFICVSLRDDPPSDRDTGEERGTNRPGG